MNRDNQPVFNANRKVANYKDFSADVEEKKLGKVRRSFQPNSDRQNFPSNDRNEFDPITRKITQVTLPEVEDKLDAIEQDKIVENNQWKMTPNTRKYYDMLSKISDHLKKQLDASPQDTKDKFADMAEKFEGLGKDSQGNPIANGFWVNNEHIIKTYTLITLIENANKFFEVVEDYKKKSQNAPSGDNIL